MNTKSILVVTIFLTTIVSVFSSVGLKLEHRGNCSSSNYAEKYVNFTYFSDSTNYFTVFPDLCGSDKFQPKQLFTPFHEFIVDSVTISPNDCEIRMIFDSTISSSGNYVYGIEFYSDSLKKSVAFEYASPYDDKNIYGKSVSFNYVIELNNDIGFASEYTPSEIDEVQIFNNNRNILFELQDKDRSNMLVGLRYFSNENNLEYIYYFVPNN